mgnify:CR=1 FL=1
MNTHDQNISDKQSGLDVKSTIQSTNMFSQQPNNISSTSLPSINMFAANDYNQGVIKVQEHEKLQKLHQNAQLVYSPYINNRPIINNLIENPDLKMAPVYKVSSPNIF